MKFAGKIPVDPDDLGTELALPSQQSMRASVAAAANRLVVGLTVAAIPALFLVAGQLTADPQGLGTHQQLGLPPCSIRLLAGIRCPACGMTTSWTHLAHGNLQAAWKANAGGACLAAWAALAWGLAVSNCIRRNRATSFVPVLALSAIAVVTITAVDWLIRVL